MPPPGFPALARRFHQQHRHLPAIPQHAILPARPPPARPHWLPLGLPLRRRLLFQPHRRHPRRRVSLPRRRLASRPRRQHQHRQTLQLHFRPRPPPHHLPQFHPRHQPCHQQQVLRRCQLGSLHRHRHQRQLPNQRTSRRAFRQRRRPSSPRRRRPSSRPSSPPSSPARLQHLQQIGHPLPRQLSR